MNPTIEITSLAVNKLKNSHDDFVKYNIDVSLDEIENNESGIKLKYKFILLSNPTNTKLTIEGIAALFGNDMEISKQLEPDQKNIPNVVNNVYQEVFPLIYIISKSLQIPCPAYRLSQISSVQTQETAPMEDTKPQDAAEQPSEIPPMAEEISTEPNDLASESLADPVIQEANVSSI
jgi:hypothetical protein